jgi:hypothetical protein
VIFAAPLALLGLLALPVLAWLHRRRRRPAPVEVPSLMFLEGEPAETFAPERVRLDAELALSLLAAALLSLAAADPARTASAPGRTVRVVVDAGPAMAARDASGTTAAQRAEAAVSEVVAALSPQDRLVRQDAAGGRGDLLARARAGEAAVRIVVTDRRPRDPPADVRFVLVGAPRARDVGIVAVDVVERQGAAEVFANVWNDGPEVERVTLTLEVDDAPVEGRALEIAPRAAASSTFSRPMPLPERMRLRIVPPDDLASDDVVDLRRAALRVAIRGAGATPALREAVLAGLRATMPADAVVEDESAPEVFAFAAASATEAAADAQAPASARVVLRLRSVDAGGGVRRPRDAPFEPVDAVYGRDVDPAGCDLVWAAAPAGAGWPFVRRSRASEGGPDVVEFGPDPLAGHPAPVEHALWPVFLDDVVRALRGRAGPASYRVQGTLDVEASSLGRDVAAFSPAWVREAPPDRVPPRRPLAVPLLVGAALCLAGLWLLPALRNGGAGA